MMHRLFNLVLYALSGLAPRRPHRIVFGAWLGRRYADNPRYLFEYLCRTRPDLDVRWIGDPNELKRMPGDWRSRFFRRSSLSAFWSVVTAARIYVSHGYSDVSPYNLCHGAIVTYLGHGLTIKRMGGSPRPEAGLAGLVRKAFRWANSFDYFAASSEEHAQKLLAEYHGNGIDPQRIIFLGQPRTDPLLSQDRDDRGRRIRRTLLELHGLSADLRLVTYLPTFRDSGARPFSFLKLESGAGKAVEDVLERHGAVLVEKMHFVDSVQRRFVEGDSRRRIVELGTDASIDTQDLLLATDVLLTDYSGCYLDYLHLDRPVLHFVYDLEAYSSADRGLYYPLEHVAGGPVVRNLGDLLRHLDACLRDPGRDRERRRVLRDRFLAHDTEDSSSRFSAVMSGCSVRPRTKSV